MTNEKLVELYQNGDKLALDELVKNNGGIITTIVNKYMGINNELEFDDLFNSGVIGLIYAANKYDFNNTKKAQFITYAVSYINRYINSCVNGNSSKEIENNKFYKSCVSLNTPIGEDEDCAELLDTIKEVCMDYEYIEDKIYNGELRKDLEKAMNECNTLREREILKLHYGWDCDACSYSEIGKIFNVSKSRSQQIESEALRKMRNGKYGPKLGGYYLINSISIIKNKSKYSVSDADKKMEAEPEIANITMREMYLDGYSASEIARVVNKSVCAVSKTIQRKYKDLKPEHDIAIARRKKLARCKEIKLYAI